MRLLSAAAAACVLAAAPAAATSPVGEGSGAALSYEDESRLPDDGTVEGWQRSGPARVYVGRELYELIDGGAEAFFEQGFERVTVQQYARDSAEIEIALYAMRDAAAALGIFLARGGEETPAPGLALRHSAGRHELLAVQSRFYVVVSDLTGRGERGAELVGFARALEPRLPPAEKVAALELLPAEGRLPGSERLVRGPLALQSFIQLAEGDALQLGGRVSAAAAGYKGPAGRFTLVVAPYVDAETARRTFEHLQAHLDPEIEPLERTASRLVFRDYSSSYGEAVLRGSRIELRLGLAERPY